MYTILSRNIRTIKTSTFNKNASLDSGDRTGWLIPDTSVVRDHSLAMKCSTFFPPAAEVTRSSRPNQPIHAIIRIHLLTLLEPQSRLGDKPLKLQETCPQNGPAVL